MAMSLAVVRSWVEKAVFIMGSPVSSVFEVCIAIVVLSAQPSSWRREPQVGRARVNMFKWEYSN